MLAILAASQVLLTNEGVQLTPTALAILGGTILPLLVAFSTHITASGKVKVIVNTVLAILMGLGTYVVSHDGKVTYAQLFICVASAFAASGISNNHFWKQLNVTAWIAVATHYFGIGKDTELNSKLLAVDATTTELKKVLTSPLGIKIATAALVNAKDGVPSGGVVLNGDLHLHGDQA